MSPWPFAGRRTGPADRVVGWAHRRRRADGERGQVLVLFTLSIVVIMLSVAIVVDIGRLRNDRQVLANALDAAVLAGGTLLPVDGCNTPPGGSACASVNTAAVTAINDRMVSTVAANFPGITAANYTITYYCLVGVNSAVPPGPNIARDVPEVCNPRTSLGHVPVAADFRGTGSTRFSTCNPTVGDKCNAVALAGGVSTSFSFARVVGIDSGNTNVVVSTACNGPCGQAPARPVDLVVLVDRTASMSSVDIQNARDAARAILGVYDPAQQRLAVGFLGPSDAAATCSGSGGGPAVHANALVPSVPTAPAYAASSSGINAGTGASTLVVNRPTGTSSGHVLLAGVTVAGGTGVTVTPPSGWTLVRRTDNSTNLSLITYVRVAGASEPASYTWTLSPSSRAAGSILRFTGVNTTSPIDVSAGQSTTNNSHPYRVVAPTMSTTGDAEALAGFYAVGAGTTFSNNSLLTDEVDVRNTNASGPSLRGADGIQATTGATGTSYATAGAGGQMVAQHIALRPTGASVYGTAYPLDLDKWIPVGFTGTDTNTPAQAWDEAYSDGHGLVAPTTHIVSAINCFDNPGGTGTNLATPVAMAAAYLQAYGRPHAKWGILLETDGQPSYSNTGDPDNYTCAAAMTAATSAKAITNGDGSHIDLFTVGFGLDGANDVDCPDTSGAWRAVNVTSLLAQMATTTYAPRPDGVNSGCVSAENSDGDHFFCQPRTDDLTSVFQQVATQLAGIRTHLIALNPSPVVTGVSPATGPARGGTLITLTGKYFTGATTVKVGATSVAFTLVNDTTIRITTPAGTAGAVVDVIVTSPGGTSPAHAGDHFAYS